MNKFRNLIILFITCVSTAYGTEHHSGKTFLMPRSDGVNKALEGATWHTHIYSKHNQEKSHLKSNIQITPFYQASTHEKRMGEYFGIGNCSNCFTIGNVHPEDITMQTPAEIDGSFLIHNVDVNGPDETFVVRSPIAAAKICFNPERNVVGARLDYFQDINSPIKGLFFKASVPFAYVEHKLGASFCNEVKATIGTKTFGLRDFFNGCVRINTGDDVQLDQNNNNNPENPNLQCPLQKLKFGCGKRSKFGIADIDIALGYKYSHCKDHHAFLSAGFTIPTGNKPKSEYLFEPIYGNGHHFGIFATVDAGMNLWEGPQGWLRVNGGINFKYLFEGTEKRMLGLKDIPFGHYFLGGRLGHKNEPLFPLANILCRDFRVKPGHQLDALVDFSFQNKCIVIDVGYNLYWKDQESLWEKEPICLGTYGIALPTYSTSSDLIFGIDTKTTLNDAIITHDDLDFDAAKTPDQITHKIFAAVGYKYMINQHCPATVSLGGSYEFSQTNAAFEQWGIWGKVGFTF